MKQDFIIITQPRSGDEILISQLRSHPNVYISLGKPLREFSLQSTIKTFDEYLQHKYKHQNYEIKYREQDIMHSLNTKTFMEEYYNEYFELTNAEVGERVYVKDFLDKIYSKDKSAREEGYKAATEYAYTRYKKYGFTVYIEDIMVSNILEDLIQKNPKLKIIFLYRKNLLFRYVSQLLPTETNEHGYTKIIGTSVTVDKEQVNRDIIYRQQEQNIIKEKINLLNLEHIEITYEDLVTSNRKTLDTIQSFINVPIQEKDLFGINVNNIFEETRPLEVIVDNYAELKESCPSLKTYLDMAEKSANPFYYEIRKAGTFASLEFLKEMVDGGDKNFYNPDKHKEVMDTIKQTISGGVADY